MMNNRFQYGGQAVIEGVMMRGRRSLAIAVRRPSSQIVVDVRPVGGLSRRFRLLRLPFVRGVVMLVESLVIGMQALMYSANQVVDEEEEFSPLELAGTLALAFGLFVLLFIVLPNLAAVWFQRLTGTRVVLSNLVEGVLRVLIFLAYIVGISRLRDIQRVFEYHGAEHKVIHAYESCGRPDARRAVGFSTRHPRCGTGFLLIVMVIAVFVFAIVGKPSLPWLVLSRIVGIPLIIGVSYEIGIKWLGKHPDGFIARFLLWPGLQLQRLTTREPTPDQLEVAAAALEETMRMDEVEYSALAEAAART